MRSLNPAGSWNCDCNEARKLPSVTSPVSRAVHLFVFVHSLKSRRYWGIHENATVRQQ